MKRISFVLAAISVLAAAPPAMAQREALNPPSVVCAVPNPHVSVIRPAPAIRYASTAPLPVERKIPTGMLFGLPLMGLAFIGAIKTVASDKDSYPGGQSTRVQLNALIASFNYFLNNGVMSTTVATQPGCATATVTSKVKTTNATVLKESGLAVALGASDNFWILTGGNIAAGFFRRYLLLDTAGVSSVLASSDAATKAGCIWPSIPADGTSIVGILTIQNATNPFIPATTLLGAAGVTATYIDGIDDSVFLHAQITP